MKRVTAVFLSVMLLVSLGSCGQSGTGRQENTQADEQSESSENQTQDVDLTDTPGSTVQESGQRQEPNVEDGFIRITGGTFRMGSPETESWRSDDETPHTVTVSDFYMAPYEVTQAEYEAVMGNNPSNFAGSELPVENVLSPINRNNTAFWRAAARQEIYMEFLKNLPGAGSGQPVTCSTSGMGLRLK